MRNSNWLKFVHTGVLALTLVVAPLTLPAVAQVEAEREGIYEDNDSDWSWLGLLGLAGLAGLAGKNRDQPTAYRDPNAPSSSQR